MVHFHVAAAQTGNLFGQNFKGDGTYYGDNGGAGACSFSVSDSQYLPWAANTRRVAINAPMFFGSQSCGLCASVRATGTGSGLTPLPTTTQYILVSNLCPECQWGDFDYESPGDGRWGIQWHPVQCAVGSSTFQYAFVGSNPYYIKMQITNTRVPVAAVQFKVRGTFYDMNRVQDNYFTLGAVSGQTLDLPTPVIVTSVFGDIVKDTIVASSPTGRVNGAAQFPMRSDIETVPPPGTASPPPPLSSPTPLPTSPPPANPPPPVTPPPVTQPPATPPPPPGSKTILGQWSQCGGYNGAPPGQAGNQPWPSTACSPGFVCTYGNPYYWQCLPAANAARAQAALAGVAASGGANATSMSAENKPFAAAAPSPAAAPAQAEQSCAESVQPGAQCGGSGMSCYGSQCQDNPWPGYCCAAGPGGVPQGCSRVSALQWICVRAAYLGPRAHAGQLPSPAALAAADADARADTALLDAWGPVIRAEPNAKVCNLTLAEVTGGVVANLFAREEPSCSIIVSPRVQCGGNGGTCFGAACADAAWPSACCVDPLTRCFRYNAAYWECRWGPFGSASF
ncbi:hypothetical protein WJX81_006098 [Elliptochloris bilobata]|uniref:CBM1 domain-containing protein n=1 Tax=Elliptochloris bilobata TaxID=381761 RepID=A0AAW1SK60_9CHLO